ncbi:hypothetical protein Leryth_023214 [Lithospermum erythrorhizon]|nr:hypothetical protein Leryth_023214 [Lithospermum erythrorhizon]
MDHSENMNCGTNLPSYLLSPSSSPTNYSSSPSTPPSSIIAPSSPFSTPPSRVILSPCAACKILRRRCVEKCVLAPYFPPTEPLKFAIAHKVFGASNIIKLLQELPESHRADAVNSLVYEANARIRDPVYGCAGSISQLQKQISELQAELAKAKAEVLNMQCQNSNLFSIICMAQQQIIANISDNHFGTSYEIDDYSNFFLEDGNYLGASLEQPLWA